MAIFGRIPPRGRIRYEEGPWQRFFRIILISLIFCGVILGFWHNSGQRMQELLQRNTQRVDTTGILTQEQEAQLHIYANKFFETYGTRIFITIQETALTDIQGRNSGSVFLGINPKDNHVIFYAPPLVAAALGDTFIRYITHEHFSGRFDKEIWPDALAQALSMLSTRLDTSLSTHNAQ